MSYKRDHFVSVRAALRDRVSIGCQLEYADGKRLMYGSQMPFYTFNGGLGMSQYLLDQLRAADAFGLLAWEMVEQHTPTELNLMAEENTEPNKVFYRWRKQLVRLDATFNTSKNVRPALGERRVVTAQAQRHKIWHDNPHGVSQQVAFWKSHPVTPIEAVYCGYRTVYEGWIEHTGYNADNPGEFHVVRSIEIWKFVDNPRHADYYVLPFDTRELVHA